MVDIKRFTAAVTAISDVISGYPNSTENTAANARVHNSLLFFVAAASSNKQEFYDASMEAAVREVRAAAELVIERSGMQSAIDLDKILGTIT